MDNMRLSDELRQQLMESAAWGKAGINVEVNDVGAEEQETLEEGTAKVSEEEAEEAVNEEEEEAVHVCPLCISQLDEAIEEEALLEHLEVVLGLVERLSQINEGEEDIDAVIDETLEALLLGDTEEEEDTLEEDDTVLKVSSAVPTNDPSDPLGSERWWPKKPKKPEKPAPPARKKASRKKASRRK